VRCGSFPWAAPVQDRLVRPSGPGPGRQRKSQPKQNRPWFRAAHPSLSLPPLKWTIR
jgi:hypothetical protein